MSKASRKIRRSRETGNRESNSRAKQFHRVCGKNDQVLAEGLTAASVPFFIMYHERGCRADGRGDAVDNGASQTSLSWARKAYLAIQTGVLLVIVVLMVPAIGVWRLVQRRPWGAGIMLLAAGILATLMSR